MQIRKTILFILLLCATGALLLSRALRPAVLPDVSAVGTGVVLREQPDTGRGGASAEQAASEGGANGTVVQLIQGGSLDSVLWASRTPAAKRARLIEPDPAWMTPDPVLKAGDRIELALFEDAVFEAQLSNVTRYLNGAVGMTAQLQGGRKGTIYLSYCDGALRIAVEAQDGAQYAVRYKAEENAHYALEVDLVNTLVFNDVEPAVPDTSLDLSVSDAVAVADLISGAPSGSIIIDVMIAYTPAALAYEGSSANMSNNIALAMQQANAAHTNSNTGVYLNLVRSCLTDYVEKDYALDLTNLTLTADGYMDELHSQRTQYGADLVCLFKTDPTYGGYGWVLKNPAGSPDYGFCWVNIQQSDRLYTTVHEWGHNMGCHHSKTQVSSPGPGLYSYSAGWQWNDPYPPAAYGGDYAGYCSVMTYQDFDNDRRIEYIRAPHFSNPSISYTYGATQATGDAADGDNARTIRQIRTVIAAYRKAPDLDYDGLPNEWELQYFGGETNANPAAMASNGVNTVLEAYIAGISPVNPQSLFSVTDAAAEPAGFVVRWNAVTGRVYGVDWTAGLPSGFQPLATNIVWPQAAYTDSVHGTQSEGFYRVRVQLAPSP